MSGPIIQCYPYSPPVSIRRGLKTPTYTASWFVEVNDVLVGERVIELAADADLVEQTGNALDEPIPALGDSLNWKSPGDDPEFNDTSALALDFNANLWFAPEDNPHCWRVDITWRSPDPMKNEVPGSINALPLARPPVYWIEYNNYSERVAVAARVTDVATGAITADEVMTNSAGEQMPPLSIDLLRPVIVIQRNVGSPTVALTQNETYEDTVNEAEFSLLGKNIAKHHARYIRAETGQVEYESGQTFYRMLTRIELSRTPYYRYRFNEGNYYLSDGKRKVVQDDDGFTVPGPYPLKTDGDLAASVSDFNDRIYLTSFTQDFTSLVS